MSFWEAVVSIVAIGAIVRIVQARHGISRPASRFAEAPARETPGAETTRLREEVASLKERIAVLERLATDTNRAIDLDREIEKLR